MSEALMERPHTTVKRYDPRVKAEAYERFLTSDMDLIDIAIVTGVPKHVVAAWANEGSWTRRKEELELELLRSAESKYRNFLLEHKIPTLERHIKASAEIENQVMQLVKRAQEAVDEGTSLKEASSTLKRLAETLAAVTGVSARATGMADKVVQQQIGAAEQGRPGKTPLVAIGIAPKLARETEITVTEVQDGQIGETRTVSLLGETRDTGAQAPDGTGVVCEVAGT